MKVIVAKSFANGTRYGACFDIGPVALIAAMHIFATGLHRNPAGMCGFLGPFGFIWTPKRFR